MEIHKDRIGHFLYFKLSEKGTGFVPPEHDRSSTGNRSPSAAILCSRQTDMQTIFHWNKTDFLTTWPLYEISSIISGCWTVALLLLYC